MNRTEVELCVKEQYAVVAEYLWEEDNITAVFRHENNKKWFGVLMQIPASKLGLNSERPVDVLDIKLEPAFIQELLREKHGQVFPAYRMNKKHWLTILLSSSTEADLVKALIDQSYGLTL